MKDDLIKGIKEEHSEEFKRIIENYIIKKKIEINLKRKNEDIHDLS